MAKFNGNANFVMEAFPYSYRILKNVSVLFNILIKKLTVLFVERYNIKF